MLEDLGGFLLEHVLSFLSPLDYSQLCLTSHVLYLQTSDYLLHKANTIGRDLQIKLFFEENQSLLLPKERQLYEHFLSVITQNPDVTYQKLPVYHAILDLITDSEDVRRVSIITSHMFSYLGDTDHVFVKNNEELGRDVVFLKEISWLMFCTNLPKFCAEVYPASYQIRLHLQIRDDVVWKGDKPMVVRLLKCKSHELVRHNFIHPSVWRDVSQGKHVDLSYNNYNDKNLKIVATDTPSWFFLVIDNVSVVEGDELYFTIDDRQNVFWKSGKSWDFLEIIRLK